MNQPDIKICIVEDDNDIRGLTKEVLEYSGNIICTYEFSSAEDFLKQAKDLTVDIVLMDIGLPKMTGTDCVKFCNLNNMNLDFIMYTTHFVADEVFEALRAGAKGYILKGCPPHQLIQDIMEMHKGGSPMSPQISRLVTESFNQFSGRIDELSKLTRQEKEILSDLDKGLNYKEIATMRFISPHTVRAHIRSIYEKLHVHSKLEAIRLFQKSLN
ncbi:MAG: response regulator transcription factor [Saprospiraceae bacterium]|nr:response regulator transcription factor [Saprospiraceae bacterium]